MMDRNVYSILVMFVWILVLTESGSATKICWTSTWFNDSTPTPSNKSDYEHQPASVLNALCTSGKVLEAQCKDEKGEAFTNFKNDSSNMYVATCNVVTGLICHPYNTTNQKCPDFAIQYGCQCPTTTTAQTSLWSSSFGMPTQQPGSGLRGTTTTTMSTTKQVRSTNGPGASITQSHIGPGQVINPSSQSAPLNNRPLGQDNGTNKLSYHVLYLVIGVMFILGLLCL